MNVKMSNFIIALLFVSFCAIGINLWIMNGVLRYSPQIDSDSNESMNNIISQFNTLNSSSSQIKEEVIATTVESSVFDIIGSFFRGIWSVIITTLESVTISTAMVNEVSTSGLKMGLIGSQLRMLLVSLIFILVFVGYGISVIVKMRS